MLLRGGPYHPSCRATLRISLLVAVKEKLAPQKIPKCASTVIIFRGHQAVLSRATNMRSDEGQNPVRNEAGTGRRGYALWYVQHEEGSRSYVRVTGLGLLVAAIFTLIPALLILILFFSNQAQQQRDLENVNIIITPRTPDNVNYQVIRPAPPPSPLPKVPNRPAIKAHNAAVTPTPGRNINGR